MSYQSQFKRIVVLNTAFYHQLIGTLTKFNEIHISFCKKIWKFKHQQITLITDKLHCLNFMYNNYLKKLITGSHVCAETVAAAKATIPNKTTEIFFIFSIIFITVLKSYSSLLNCLK